MGAFDRVVGQLQAVAALESQLARTGGSGSTLILGPEGVGRFLLARCAARAILGPAERTDLCVLDPEAGIDGVRGVRALLARKPLEGPRQVLILRDLDRFSREAQHALLKTLEEPPAGAAVFLVAEGAAWLPETILSRCRVVRAGPLSDADCAAVAGVEVRDAEGSPGRALYQASEGVAESAARLLQLLGEASGDPLAQTESLVRKRPGEESKPHRRRMIETLRVAAARLRRELPESAGRLCLCVQSLRLLRAHANAGIVFAELALQPWKTPSRT